MRYNKDYWRAIGWVFITTVIGALIYSRQEIDAGTMTVEGSPFTPEGFLVLLAIVPIAFCVTFPILHIIFLAINKKNKHEAAVAFGLSEGETKDNSESPMEMLKRNGIK